MAVRSSSTDIPHEQFVELFHTIGSDRENRVVILTGSGEAFMDSISPEGFDFFSPQGYDKIYREGKKVLMNILDIEVPLIAAVNGPVRLHSEYILLADIVLASPSTVFQDKPHFEFGIVPGDGVNLLWQEMIGSVRGRYFILTRQEGISARMSPVDGGARLVSWGSIRGWFIWHDLNECRRTLSALDDARRPAEPCLVRTGLWPANPI